MTYIYGNMLDNLCVHNSWAEEVPLASADPLDVLIALENMDAESREEMYEVIFTSH